MCIHPEKDSWPHCKHAETLPCLCCSLALVNPHLMLSIREIYALAGVNLWETASSVGRTLAKKLLCWKKKKKREKADLKDLFLSTPRMHDIFNLFIWVKQSFQGGKPTRRDKAELCLATPPHTPPNPCFQQYGPRVLAQIYLVVIVFVWGGGGLRVMHHFLPFVCFAFYW